MHVSLTIKTKCSFFWLRAIRRVRIDKCCAQCFIGDKFNEVYEKSYYKDSANIELDIEPDTQVKAYYLCGLSRGMKYENNTHVAFVPCASQNILVDNDRIQLEITNAKLINFQGYRPNPVGEYTNEQRACRNWIFANYLLDGMPL